MIVVDIAADAANVWQGLAEDKADFVQVGHPSRNVGIGAAAGAVKLDTSKNLGRRGLI